MVPLAMPDTHVPSLAEFLKNKTVALVGPAESLAGAQYGGEIDAFDVVVRLKFAESGLAADMGRRTDIIYFTPYQDAASFAEQLMTTHRGARLLVSTYPYIKRHKKFLKEFARLNLPVKIKFVSKLHRKFLLMNMVGKPYTGITALFHLLTYPIARLKIFGIDFYTTGYRDEYIAKVVGPINKVQKNTTKCVPDIVVFSKRTQKMCHNNISQFEFFRNYIFEDRRVALDDNLSAIVKASDKAEIAKQCRLLPRIKLAMFKLLLHLSWVLHKNKGSSQNLL
jgi:hypothetical protein